MPCFSSLPRKDSSLLSRSCSSACSLSYEVEPSDEYLYVQPPLPAYAPRQSPATIPPYSSYSNPVLLPRVRSSEESNHRPFSSTSDSVSPFPPLPPEELQTSTCLSPPAKQPVPPKSVPVASNRTKRSKKCKAKGGAEHYVIDPQRVLSNEDSRQFLMIKNIPNRWVRERESSAAYCRTDCSSSSSSSCATRSNSCICPSTGLPSVTWDMAMYRWLIPGRSSRSTKLWAVGGEFHVDAWQALAKLLQSQTLRDCVRSHPRSS